MSRKSSDLNEHITVHGGDDHAVGSFFEITDKRSIDEPGDSGEGYVFQWDEAFGIGINKIKTTIEDIKKHGPTYIIEMCDKYQNSKNG